MEPRFTAPFCQFAACRWHKIESLKIFNLMIRKQFELIIYRNFGQDDHLSYDRIIRDADK